MSTRTEQKHTAGPWRVDDRNVVIQDGAREEVGPFVIIADDPDAAGEVLTLAEIQDDGEPGVALADARLMAASPELLAALKVLLKYLDPHYLVRGTPEYAVAEAAIAKAEGRTS